MSLGQTNTAVSRPQSLHHSDHSALCCNYTPLPAVKGAGGAARLQTSSLPPASLQACAGKTERVRETGRVSEREGEVKTALSGTERQEERQEILLLPEKD